jgi:hypothetical protein
MSNDRRAPDPEPPTTTISKNSRALAREEVLAAFGAPRRCETDGCDQPARRRWCASHGAEERQRCATERQSRWRERQRMAEESRIDAIDVRVTFASSVPEAFPRAVTSFDVAECLADDHQRFRQMYARRRHTPIPQIDRIDRETA